MVTCFILKSLLFVTLAGINAGSHQEIVDNSSPAELIGWHCYPGDTGRPRLIELNVGLTNCCDVVFSGPHSGNWNTSKDGCNMLNRHMNYCTSDGVRDIVYANIFVVTA